MKMEVRNSYNYMKKYNIIFTVLLVCFCFTAKSQEVLIPEVSTNNWYVGNTKAGEWIKYKRVWLSAGHYRFTTNAVAKNEGQIVCLALNDIILESNVSVPVDANNKFKLVHLGSKNLPEGYYDIKLVFETGNVNCDMIFIRKSDNTTTSVLEDDTHFTINRTDGPHIAPIGGPINASSQLAKGSDKNDNGSWKDANGRLYTREQMLTWYKQQIYAYTPETSDRAMDYYVSEQVEAKVDFIFSHGRGDVDFENDIEDRAYKTSHGGYFGCRLLKKLIEAINRNVYAKDNLKIAYFFDSGNMQGVYELKYSKGEVFKWDEEKSQECIWERVIEPFYDNFIGQEDMLFYMEDGKTPLQMWTSNSSFIYDKPKGERKIKEFLEVISDKMFAKYGFRPAWILSEDFFENDPRLRDKSSDIVSGVQAWFGWGDSNRTSIRVCPVTGKKYAFALNGGRQPLSNHWYNDWAWTNPTDYNTYTGTLRTDRNNVNKPGDHISALDASGNPVIRPIFEQAIRENAEWVVLESWSDWSEGSTWYRSDHKEYAYPNQHLAFIREYADRNSESIILEAEACDEYYNLSPGNRGGAYRVNWNSELKKDFWDADKEIDLDIYRPLHKLGEWVAQGTPGSDRRPIIGFAAGNKDVWSYNDLWLYMHQIDGHPANNWAFRDAPPASIGVKKIAVGGSYIWTIGGDNEMYRAELPNQEAGHRLWVKMTAEIKIKDLDISLSMGWAVDTNGKVYYRDLEGTKPWTLVPGTLQSITAEDMSVWGFTTDGKLMRMSAEKKTIWEEISNPHNLTKISGSSGEIWGVNAENKVYRINASGDGPWQWVADGYKDVAVGMEYVWLQDLNNDLFNCKISGFESTTVFSSSSDDTAIDNHVAVVQNIHLYPIPFVNEIHLDIVTNKPTDAVISISNMSGQVLLTQQEKLEQGMNNVLLTNLSSLPKGVYLCSVKTDTIKVFKTIKTN
jgi:hypothetical protein